MNRIQKHSMQMYLTLAHKILILILYSKKEKSIRHLDNENVFIYT